MKKKIKTRKITLVIPESSYQLFKQTTVLANQTAVAAGKGLEKVSDIIREAMIKGLTAWKGINREADKRLREQAKEELREVGKKSK